MEIILADHQDVVADHHDVVADHHDVVVYLNYPPSDRTLSLSVISPYTGGRIAIETV